MEATALICDEQQHFGLQRVQLPAPSPNDLVVQTLCSGISMGTELALIRGKVTWGPYPLCTGYQAVGVVETVGAEVTGYAPGDRVYYRDNQPMRLAGGAAVSPVSGTHCSAAVIDPLRTHGVAPIPKGVSADVGSLFVQPAVGLFGVDMTNPRMGETVIVQGLGLVGLGVVAACAHRGCVVIGIDTVDRRLALAREMGADHVLNPSRDDVHTLVTELSPTGADTVFECTGIPSLIDSAIALCREHGKLVWQGNYGEAPVQMHFLPPHSRQLTMLFPCDDGLAPCRRAVMKSIAFGYLPWEKVITHRVPPDNAPALFDRINRGQAPDVDGAVIQWAI